ncbi:hypothetical protein B0H14DRAFT_3434494 [Mycena olivaceomarginata]|nr:hypothetical protein B0H14DRAFT_3434494 [Mycena olivaceomarginata]
MSDRPVTSSDTSEDAQREYRDRSWLSSWMREELLAWNAQRIRQAESTVASKASAPPSSAFPATAEDDRISEEEVEFVFPVSTVRPEAGIHGAAGRAHARAEARRIELPRQARLTELARAHARTEVTRRALAMSSGHAEHARGRATLNVPLNVERALSSQTSTAEEEGSRGIHAAPLTNVLIKLAQSASKSSPIRFHASADIAIAMQTMSRNPVRTRGEEECIAYDFPARVDKSEVTYSWDGLRFLRAST